MGGILIKVVCFEKVVLRTVEGTEIWCRGLSRNYSGGCSAVTGAVIKVRNPFEHI